MCLIHVDTHRTGRGLILAIVLASGSTYQLVAQVPPPPQARHATYDFTEGSLPGEPNLGLKEVWVDSKSPGDGFTYSVGTIEVQRTVPGPANPAPVLYSGQGIQPAFPLLGFDSLPPAVVQKQVVVIQCVDATQQVVWQRFYYGFIENGNRQINVRGMSVWPAANGEDTRIAICGESANDWLPLDQLGMTLGFASPRWRGFVAVFNNRAFPVGPQLLWSHQFYGRSSSTLALAGDMAITDVSIRVDDGEEVVTYCGISTCGIAGLDAGSTVPVNWFAPPTGCATDNPAGGNADNGAGNWDGFVGRITRPVGNPAAIATTVFHAVVGGNVTDGLFGLAEADENRFCVVGLTAQDGAGSATPSLFSFPFNDGVCLGVPTQLYSLGVVMQFDATNTAANGALILDWSQRIGAGASVEPSTFTVARDVVMQRDWIDGDLAVVVGSTDDPDLANNLPNSGSTTLASFGPQTTIGGATDGFVLTCLSLPQTPVGPYEHATYRGGEGGDGLAGVQSWNEFPDHFAVVGFVDAQATGADLDVGSYWTDTTTLVPSLVAARSVRLGTTASYQPTALGAISAGFAGAQGGGVTVDETGRVTAVGALVGPGPTYDATPGAGPILPGRANNYPSEAYRVVLDMLPNPCGRTDGTGSPTGAGNPQYPLPGLFGGTTPECALVPFGTLIGAPPAANPTLARMLIDYVGNDPADNQSMTVVVDRPPAAGAPISLSAWQLGFPGVGAGGGAPVPAVLPEGVILWTVNSPLTYVLTTVFGSVSQQWTLPDLPFGQTEVVTVQLFCLLDPGQQVPGGNLGPACAGLSGTAASPALWFSYTGQ